MQKCDGCATHHGKSWSVPQKGMLKVANLAITKLGKKPLKMTESLAHWHLSSPQELTNEYQHDRVKMFFKNLCALAKSSLSMERVKLLK